MRKREMVAIVLITLTLLALITLLAYVFLALPRTGIQEVKKVELSSSFAHKSTILISRHGEWVEFEIMEAF